jgi:hypothetical protein
MLAELPATSAILHCIGGYLLVNQVTVMGSYTYRLRETPNLLDVLRDDFPLKKQD